MNRTFTFMFVSTQIAGESLEWALLHVTGPQGPWLWLASVILLLPGDLIAAWAIEKFLWTTRLTSVELQILKTTFEFAINAGLWVLVARQWVHVRARPRRTSVENQRS